MKAFISGGWSASTTIWLMFSGGTTSAFGRKHAKT